MGVYVAYAQSIRLAKRIFLRLIRFCKMDAGPSGPLPLRQFFTARQFLLTQFLVALGLSLKGPLLRGPTAKPPFWSRLTLSGRLYTPTLIRPDNEPEGWVMSCLTKLTWVARHIHSGAA